MKALATSAVLLLTGCASDEPVAVEGPHYQYVVSELRIPSNNAMARENGLDLNGDTTVDNQLGMVFGTLEGQGLGVGETAREALLRGGLVMLADLQTTDFDNIDLAGFSTWLGDNLEPAPCLDPTMLETCGQHLRGNGRFSVDEDSASHQIKSEISNGVFEDKAVFLPVELVIDDGRPIRLDLRGARVRLTQISETQISAIFAGGVTEGDIENVIIPEAAANCDRIVRNECSQPLPMGSEPCGCVPGSRSNTLRRLFDEDRDCRIDAREVSTNSLVRALLPPDIRVDGQDLLSFGVGVELARASF